jgi:hypothetical protein
VHQLVDLFLVLDDGKAGLGVAEDVLHLFFDGVLIERHRHAAQRLRGEDGPVELRAVVADDGDLVAAPKAEGGEAESDEPALLEVLAPRGRLPDAEVLLAHGNLAGQTLRVGAGKLRERVVRYVLRQVH